MLKNKRIWSDFDWERVSAPSVVHRFRGEVTPRQDGGGFDAYVPLKSASQAISSQYIYLWMRKG